MKMLKLILKLANNFGVFIGFLYCLALGFSVYEVGFQKTVPWIFCGMMMVNFHFALKTKHILKEVNYKKAHY